MKAITIFPGDIGASGEWSSEWIRFIKKLGYKDGDSLWSYAVIVNIETDN